MYAYYNCSIFNKRGILSTDKLFRERTSLPSAPINAYLRVPTKYKFSFAKYQTGQIENERSVSSLIDRRRFLERGVYSCNFNELNKTYKACYRRKFSPSNDISRLSLTLVFIAEAFLKQDYCIVNMLISGVYK